MFILDDIMLAPIKGIQWIAREMDRAALAELEQQCEQVTEELDRLVRLHETGRLDSEEFEVHEAELNERRELLSQGIEDSVPFTLGDGS